MKGDTPAALFSPALWTGGGMLSAEGDRKGVTFFDRVHTIITNREGN